MTDRWNMFIHSVLIYSYSICLIAINVTYFYSYNTQIAGINTSKENLPYGVNPHLAQALSPASSRAALTEIHLERTVNKRKRKCLLRNQMGKEK